MIPDWPKLWEREPSLKPKYVFFNDGPDGTKTTVGDPTGLPRMFGPAAEKIAAALCRDKAVQWLGDGECWWISEISWDGQCAKPWWVWMQMPRNGGLIAYNEDDPIEFKGKTIDAALHAACTAILDARDKAKQPA